MRQASDIEDFPVDLLGGSGNAFFGVAFHNDLASEVAQSCTLYGILDEFIYGSVQHIRGCRIGGIQGHKIPFFQDMSVVR